MKVGVIGAGNIAEFHLQGYQLLKDVEIFAVCDLNRERAKQKAERYGAAHAFEDYKDLLALDEIEAVSICTWNDTHSEIAIAALDAGKHVLVEKPLCMSMEEASRIREAVERNNQIFQVGFVRRHGVNARILKEFIDKGELGDIYYAKTSCIRRLGNPGGWFADKKRSGGGPLIDLGVHMIDLCWYMMGRPKVQAVVGNTYNRLGNRSNVQNLDFYKAADYDPDINSVEDMANGLIRFENGASLAVDVSFTLHSKQDELNAKLYGTSGGAELEPELQIITEKHNTILNATPQIDTLTFDFDKGFHREIEHFIRSCHGLEEPISPVEDGVEVMKMLHGIYESADKKREITFREESQMRK
ncbi:Gfo/Idh/MocA family oxidoreductase [Pseudalkalibacillus sp. SCS-8]|uniref:Gfo/Idh/MocA family protein n=1 Tax=Pseudalkalibacillus nanhaiensis TaxID=3115291 RepID=UPI0032DBD788